MSYPTFIGKKEGDFLYLIEDEAKHAYVRRVKPGYLIQVNDLNGNIYLGEVLEVSKKKLKAKFLKKIDVEDLKLQINLNLCVPNQLSKVDDLIPYLTELGVYKLTPVLCKNSALKEKDVLKKLEKWQKISINSIKQCKRLFPLKIDFPKNIDNIEASSDFNAVFYEREKNQSIKQYCHLTPSSVSIVIGNEGGFSDDEIKILKDKGFKSLSLGKLILRMETAVITSVCQINFCFNK